jgi:hypothetical protein
MSFVPLDTVDFSREEALEDTPVRIRAAARCKSPVPESDRSRSFDASHHHQDPARCMSTVPVDAPVQQPSIPRHRPIASRSELLRSIDESVSDLHQELHQANRSVQSVRSDASQRSRISDICRKLDVIASVVLRHERELKEQSVMAAHHTSHHHVSAERSRPAYPAYPSGENSRHSGPADESSMLMQSILKKVTEVNGMMEHVAARTQGPVGASRDRSFSSAREESMATADVSGPLVRIADALDIVTRELQRQHATIERLSRAQVDRDEEERIASVMRYNPPSDVAPSETSTRPDEVDLPEREEAMDVNQRFAQRMLDAGVEFDSQRRDRAERTPAPGDRTASVHSSTISVNEASPQRARVARMDSQSSSRISVNEESPQRARVQAHRSMTDSRTSSRISANEASPQRVRLAYHTAASRDSSTISVNEASPQRARVAPRMDYASDDSSTIGANEESPQRARVQAHRSMTDSRTSSRISANEASPQRVRLAARGGSTMGSSRISSHYSAEDASPRRVRAASALAMYDDADELVAAHDDDDVAAAEYYEPSEEFASPAQQFPVSRRPHHGSMTIPAKTSVAGDSVLRTVTKQPEFLLRSASAQKSHTRKPVVRADIFDDESDTTDAGSERMAEPEEAHDLMMHSRMTTGAQDELIRRLRLENESLKRQLHSQLVRNDDLRSAHKELPSPGASRIGRSMLA